MCIRDRLQAASGYRRRLITGGVRLHAASDGVRLQAASGYRQRLRGLGVDRLRSCAKAGVGTRCLGWPVSCCTSYGVSPEHRSSSPPSFYGWGWRGNYSSRSGDHLAFARA
eukprot:10542194-Karenia_brevis.AAC.1